MNWKHPALGIMYALFIVTQVAFLTSVPALSGDEASEGQNIVELWSGKKALFEGERSYIGPLADYIRMPFVLVFGHTTLALRLVTCLAALISFWLAIDVFTRLFGEQAMPFVLASVFFSPIFMLEQRISWAITLSPLCALLTLFFLLRSNKYSPLLAGLFAGLGIHNHFLFVPTALGIFSSWFVAQLRQPKHLLLGGLIIMGIWAGISTQVVMLLTNRDGDQGEQLVVASTVGQRVKDFPKLVPVIMSGSSYIARYTGQELSKLGQWGITSVILLLVIVGLTGFANKPAVWLWLFGTLVHLSVILIIIDRFSLRYFTIYVLAVWALAGLGMYVLVQRWQRFAQWAPTAIAALLTLWVMLAVLIPYKTSGGSTADFSLGNRTDSASALVDTQPLISCLKNVGPVFSENVHIFNRLLYLHSSISSLNIAKNTKAAQWIIDYRLQNDPAGDLCPELSHFRIYKGGNGGKQS